MPSCGTVNWRLLPPTLQTQDRIHPFNPPNKRISETYRAHLLRKRATFELVREPSAKLPPIHTLQTIPLSQKLQLQKDDAFIAGKRETYALPQSRARLWKTETTNETRMLSRDSLRTVTGTSKLGRQHRKKKHLTRTHN